MQRHVAIGLLLIGSLPNCAGPSRPGPAATTPSLSADTVAEKVASVAAFARPLQVEIWAHAGPSTLALEAGGLLARHHDAGRLRLTDVALGMGASENYFDESLPVFYVPVARRELVAVDSISASAVGPGYREVAFRYREAPNAAGALLMDTGVRGPGLPAPGDLNGRALFVLDDAGWSVALLDFQHRTYQPGPPGGPAPAVATPARARTIRLERP